MKRDLGALFHSAYLEIQEEATGVPNSELIKAALKQVKEENACEDCHQFFHFSAMDFDHLSGKEFGIAIAPKNVGTIMIELQKCELVCSNCHRIRTHKRGKRI